MADDLAGMFAAVQLLATHLTTLEREILAGHFCSLTSTLAAVLTWRPIAHSEGAASQGCRKERELPGSIMIHSPITHSKAALCTSAVDPHLLSDGVKCNIVTGQAKVALQHLVKLD